MSSIFLPCAHFRNYLSLPSATFFSHETVQVTSMNSFCRKKQGNCKTRTWDKSSCRATARDFGSSRRMSGWPVSHSEWGIVFSGASRGRCSVWLLCDNWH